MFTVVLVTENIRVSDGLRHIMTFLIIAPYKYCYLLTYLLASIFICYQHYGKMVGFPRETFRIEGQRLRDHAIKYARWQHPSVGCVARFVVLFTT